jgi:pimeloyl-ACP methyl ester carboxylesterase
MRDWRIDDAHLLDLADGRRLEYRVSGPTDGTTLVFHHGTPGSCEQLRALAEAAHRRGLRVVTSSRAGYGRSTRNPGRRVLGAAADTAQLLDALGIDHCLVTGWSGGGPHALSCAAHMKDRVEAVLVIAGLAPADVPDLDFLAGMGEANLEEFGLAGDGQDALQPFLEEVAAGLRQLADADLGHALDSLLSDADRRALTGRLADLGTQLKHGVSEGVSGWLDDDLAFLADWGFTVAEIEAPTSIWQGNEDLMVPVLHGRWLGANLAGASTHIEPGHGHLSIIAFFVDQMLDELLALAGRH